MKVSLKTNLVAAGVAVTLIGSAFAWGFSEITAKSNTEPKTAEVIAQIVQPIYSPETPESHAIALLKTYHNQFNTWIGYGNESYFKNVVAWDSALSNEALNPLSYRQLAAKLASIQAIEIDLYRVSDLAEIANKTHDVQALIYMHRILHDLDLNYFHKTPGSDYWGITETIRHTTEAKEVIPDTRSDVAKYLEKNKV